MATKKKAVAEVKDAKLQSYELVYIVQPEMEEEAVEGKIESINQFITGNNGNVDEVERWGKKKLAYPIMHFLEGSYVLTRFTLSPTRCSELEANLKISEDILRHLLIRLNGK
jgi:small subunit ribosomal protein S6